ncbi:hypothetical protein BVY03_03685, partial [bacterium K02(2017)]
NANECKSMLKGMLVEKCNSLFPGKENTQQRESCLKNMDIGLGTCDKFFGNGGKDFCTNCTNGCIGNYKDTDPKRGQCLQTCFAQEGCQKK